MLLAFKEYCDQYMENIGDPRSAGWFLTTSPITVLSIVIAYLLLTIKIGRIFMEHREPYKLKTVIQIYNAGQVLMNTYIFYKFFMVCKNFHYFKCNSINYSNTPEGIAEIEALYAYYIAKYIDLLDTIFFVLRKKYKQISCLHLYHHSNMVLFIYWFLRFYPGGSVLLTPLLNSFVHIIMFIYYFIAAMGPKYQKYLWWKKYMTLLQLLQNFTLFGHAIFLLIDPVCNIPKLIIFVCFISGGLFSYLLVKFYISEYIKKDSNKDQKHKKEKSKTNSKLD